MRGAGGDFRPAGVENNRSGQHRYCLCSKNEGVSVPTRPLSSTCRADDATRDPGGIFTPVATAFAGPRCINTSPRAMYPGTASSILDVRMMFPARCVPLQLLPTQYLLPHASCALWVFARTQVGGRMLGLLRLP